MNISISKSGPGLKLLEERLKKLKKKDVLVGVTQKTSSRRGQPVNNAELLYVHSKGSPARNIPARPVIEPAIAADGNRENISALLAVAAKAFLDGDPSKAREALKEAGLAGQSASKAWFTDARNGWAPDQRATIARKLRKLRGKKRKAAMAVLYAGGSLQDIDSINTTLVDTGAMRQSITYVVRDSEE